MKLITEKVLIHTENFSARQHFDHFLLFDQSEEVMVSPFPTLEPNKIIQLVEEHYDSEKHGMYFNYVTSFEDIYEPDAKYEVFYYKKRMDFRWSFLERIEDKTEEWLEEKQRLKKTMGYLSSDSILGDYNLRSHKSDLEEIEHRINAAVHQFKARPFVRNFYVNLKFYPPIIPTKI